MSERKQNNQQRLGLGETVGITLGNLRITFCENDYETRKAWEEALKISIKNV